MKKQEDTPVATSRILTPFEIWYGRDSPPPPRTALRAGAFTSYLEGADLRDIRYEGVELVRRLYFALRDENWDTIPAKIENLSLDVLDDSFLVSFDAHHSNPGLDFRWHGTIQGDRSTSLTYTMSGEALCRIRYCRIGFCVLHPPGEYAGRPFAGCTPTGTISGELPTVIGPQPYEGGFYLPLFEAVSALTMSLASGVEAKFDFEGDLFEMEDQRNWTDGSFKTYSTPLSLGYPHTAKTGQVFQQRVRITASGHPIRSASRSDRVSLCVGESTRTKVPKLGLGMPTHEIGSSERDKELLEALHLDHLRLDLHLADRDIGKHLAGAEQECDALACSLELALFLTDSADQGLVELASRLPLRVPVSRVLVFHETEPVTSARWIERVRNRIGPRLSRIPIGGGTNLYFAELNRSRPRPSGLDAVVYSINPQVHASDERSVMENLEAQRDTVLTARSFCDDLPIVISPITLKPRFNPDAAEPEPPQRAGELPNAVDARQMSLFAAAWTLGSIKQLAEGGAASLTYYQTTGWRGVKETDNGCPAPELFRSAPSLVFPVYHVFADITEFKIAELHACSSSDPLRVQGLILSTGESIRVLVANLTVEPQNCTIESLPADHAEVRSLNAASAEQAMARPFEFRAWHTSIPLAGSTLTLSLDPYSVTTIDINLSERGAGSKEGS